MYDTYRIFWVYYKGERRIKRTDVFDGYTLEEAITLLKREYSEEFETKNARIEVIYLESPDYWLEVDWGDSE